MYQSIVVGITHHTTALAAAEHGMELAQATGSVVHLVYAVRPGDDLGAQTARRHADSLLETLRLTRNVPIEVHVEADKPERAILGIAARVSADLIVIGNHGLTKRGRFTSEPPALVLRDATCSVLVVDTSGFAI